MFDIGGFELLLIAVVGLLVIGPERLPEALRALGLWLGRLRRSFTSVKAEIEKEIGMDEVRRQLHNEAVLNEMKRIEDEVKGSVHDPVANTIREASGQTNESTAASAEASSASTDTPTEAPTADTPAAAEPEAGGVEPQAEVKQEKQA